MPCYFTEKDLFNYAQLFVKEYWNREFNIRIELVNRDWKRKLASYHFNLKTGDKFIRMSKIVNKNYSKDDVLNSLLHELVHWVLHSSGKPFKDDSKEFVAECIRVGAPFSKTKVAQNALKNYSSNLNNQ
ncbi:hypothetical protein BJG89_04795 [Staphylococcus nepalensis]|uniref:hypothetical protein n=1 Tax=Staphylococcus TaxID=1279 RepID=UPI000BC2FA3F|nr:MULTISPECIES: hypothetical protein [Staphylococcus]ATH59640.1 hypothetical protein BJD96_04460 [Staphylococcus nepalensis]ATH64731.1 hypothetical protein BJG89_04795 [Staphylococcus nepalensis]NWN86673.1 hypothetical protein [Staphylococcus sp.]